MKKNIFLTLSLMLSINAFATPNLGPELQIVEDPDGYQRFSAHFLYDAGSMGDRFEMAWVFGYTAKTPATGVPQVSEFKWNIFDPQSQTMLTSWDQQPLLNGRDLLLGRLAADGDFAKKIIVNQTKIIAVLGDKQGNPIFHINVGQLCRNTPKRFINLTDTEKRCDQITVEDVEAEKKYFCDEKNDVLQNYVRQGYLTCEKAKQKFTQAGCDLFKCPTE